MKKSRELKGMPILTLQEGENLGRVRDLILDPTAGQIVALVLDRRAPKGEDQVVATANVRNVGSTAITVEDRSSLVPISRIPRFQELAGMRKPIQGKVVISETGTRLGQVDDLEVDVQTFCIVSLVLKAGPFGRGQSIPAEMVRTIGADAIVVRESIPSAAAGGPQPAPAPPLEQPAPFPPAAPGLTLAVEATASANEPALSSRPVPGDAGPPPAGEGEVTAISEEPPPSEGASGESAENAWQRWVRRLKHG